MRRRFRSQAKVVRRAHQSFAEMPLPDAIDDHSSGEWILLGSDPLRQFAPATAFSDWWLRVASKKRGQPSRDYLAQPRVAAANMDRHILNVGEQPAWHSSFLDGHCQWILRGQFGLQRVALFDQC